MNDDRMEDWVVINWGGGRRRIVRVSWECTRNVMKVCFINGALSSNKESVIIGTGGKRSREKGRKKRLFLP